MPSRVSCFWEKVTTKTIPYNPIWCWACLYLFAMLCSAPCNHNLLRTSWSLTLFYSSCPLRFTIKIAILLSICQPLTMQLNDNCFYQWLGSGEVWRNDISEKIKTDCSEPFNDKVAMPCDLSNNPKRMISILEMTHSLDNRKATKTQSPPCQ